MVHIGDIPLETVYVDFISSSRSRRTPNNLVQMYCNKKVKAPNGIFFILYVLVQVYILYGFVKNDLFRLEPNLIKVYQYGIRSLPSVRLSGRVSRSGFYSQV